MILDSINMISCFSEIQIQQKTSESSFHVNFTTSEDTPTSLQDRIPSKPTG